MIGFLQQSIGRLNMRKSLTHASWIAAALAVLLASGGPAMAQRAPAANDPLVLLLTGVYQPAVNAPNLGLSGINLNDGTFITTQIHAVTTVPRSTNQDNAAVGHFYVQFKNPIQGALAVYDLPGGAIAMQFAPGSFSTQISDGYGGFYLEGTFDLTILQATGIYSSFAEQASQSAQLTGRHPHGYRWLSKCQTSPLSEVVKRPGGEADMRAALQSIDSIS